jgi:hypothetical protein
MIYEVTSDEVINWNPKTYEEKKINHVANILKTKKSEIPFMRDVGISDNYIDKPITIIKPALINDITAAINEYVYGVTLRSVNFSSSSTGDIIIKVVFEIE